jgi:hypothetical protein
MAPTNQPNKSGEVMTRRSVERLLQVLSRASGLMANSVAINTAKETAKPRTAHMLIHCPAEIPRKGPSRLSQYIANPTDMFANATGAAESDIPWIPRIHMYWEVAQAIATANFNPYLTF